MTAEYAAAKAIASEYRRAMLRAKKQGVDFTDAPQEVKDALLRLHQNALLVWMHEKKSEDTKDAR